VETTVETPSAPVPVPEIPNADPILSDMQQTGNLSKGNEEKKKRDNFRTMRVPENREKKKKTYEEEDKLTPGIVNKNVVNVYPSNDRQYTPDNSVPYNGYPTRSRNTPYYDSLSAAERRRYRRRKYHESRDHPELRDTKTFMDLLGEYKAGRATISSDNAILLNRRKLTKKKIAKKLRKKLGIKKNASTRKHRKHRLPTVPGPSAPPTEKSGLARGPAETPPLRRPNPFAPR